VLADDGIVGVNDASPTIFERSPPKLLSVGVALATVNVAFALCVAYGVAAAWLAVMVVEPAPTIVTAPVEELIVATAAFELLKVNAPLLDDVGADMVNAASPKVLVGAINEPKVGAAVSTTNVVRMVDAV
jgi:hypothetical protein